MPEIEIKRTNFFDGQFLKQDEFIDLDLYHQHLRRRWAFVLFKQSGVVQASPSDLTVEAANPANPALKSIVVRRGMAIGRVLDVAEAKEIILREDTPPIDLTVASLNVPTPLVGGSGFVTVHYLEEPIAVPASEGDVPGNTRIREHARITVHNAPPGLLAPNNEPYIRLGEVNFAAMTVSTVLPGQRHTAFLNVALLAATPTITVNPNQVTAGLTVPLTVQSTGGISLLGLTPAGVLVDGVVAPNAGVTVNSVTGQTANSAIVTVTCTAAGARTLTIGGASTTLTVQAAGFAINSFSGVALGPGNDFLTISGIGFAANQAATVFFSGVGSPPPNVAVNVAAANVTATQIRVPLAEFVGAGQAAASLIGAVTVTTGANTATSAFVVTPPAAVTAMPASVQRGTQLTVNGLRFVAPITLQLFRNNIEIMHKETAQGFPGNGESLPASQTQFTVVIPVAVSAGASELRITTAGGTVVAGALTITN